MLNDPLRISLSIVFFKNVRNTYIFKRFLSNGEKKIAILKRSPINKPPYKSDGEPGFIRHLFGKDMVGLRFPKTTLSPRLPVKLRK